MTLTRTKNTSSVSVPRMTQAWVNLVHPLAPSNPRQKPVSNAINWNICLLYKELQDTWPLFLASLSQPRHPHLASPVWTEWARIRLISAGPSLEMMVAAKSRVSPFLSTLYPFCHQGAVLQQTSAQQVCWDTWPPHLTIASQSAINRQGC